MKSISSKALALCALFGCAASAYAIPTLQVGAPGTALEGLYANYVTTSSSPTEADTAITSGNQILVGGAYSNGNNQELLIGGQYIGSQGTGQDWATILQAQFGGSLSDYAVFNGKGAILMASVPNGAVGALTINGINPFFTSTTPLFPNNHDPVKSAISDFLFFDIGNFATSGTVPNFDDETGGAVGEIKNLLIATSGFQWIHFDVMALVTKEGKKNQPPVTGLLTSLDNNPGSKDVTWKDPDGPPFGIPDPATPLLLGLGLMGLLLARHARSK